MSMKVWARAGTRDQREEEEEEDQEQEQEEQWRPSYLRH
jgi:hypothetical protein